MNFLRRAEAHVARAARALPAPSPSILALRRALVYIDSLELPYVWGGGHGPGFGPPTTGDEKSGLRGLDCSGAVSWALHLAGLLQGEPLTTTGLMRWGLAGRGLYATVWVRDDELSRHSVIETHYLGIPRWWEAGHEGMVVGFLSGGFNTTGYTPRRRP